MHDTCILRPHIFKLGHIFKSGYTLTKLAVLLIWNRDTIILFKKVCYIIVFIFCCVINNICVVRLCIMSDLFRTLM